ncbi:MAG: isoprenylcysteine carboxylmethyltransferase family protein [Pseudomonadota bacterium]
MGHWLKTDGLTIRQMVDLPPVWLIGAILLVWGQAQVWPGGTIVLPGQSILSAAFFWCGLALMGWAIWSFRQARTSVIPHQTPVRIITSGPFRFSRNPIYLGDLMVLAGVILGQGAWPSVILLPLLMVILQRRFIAQEEARMKDNFGQEFAAYAQKTRRWL